MSPELDKQLCEKYPLIFADRYADMTKTAMCWGFDCGDGWYNIIDTMCFAIQDHIDNHQTYIERDIDFNKKMEEAKNNNWENWPQYHAREPKVVSQPIPQVVATQVKEKFGGLRFYYNGGDEYIGGLIQMAELMSQQTCEVCGNHGKIYTTGWHRTLCEKHAKELKYVIR